METGVERPAGPLQMPAGELTNTLEDGVAVAVAFGQDGQHDRGGGGGYQVLVDHHDLYLAALYIAVQGMSSERMPRPRRVLDHVSRVTSRAGLCAGGAGGGGGGGRGGGARR